MVKIEHRPELIIIAGPNGSGKTSVTQKFLHHEWAEATIYINPDEVAKERFGDWNSREAILSAANYCAEWAQIICLSNRIESWQKAKQKYWLWMTTAASGQH